MQTTPLTEEHIRRALLLLAAPIREARADRQLITAVIVDVTHPREREAEVITRR